LIDKIIGKRGDENYACYLNNQMFDKLKEELIKERDQDLVNQMAQINI